MIFFSQYFRIVIESHLHIWFNLKNLICFYSKIFETTGSMPQIMDQRSQIVISAHLSDLSDMKFIKHCFKGINCICLKYEALKIQKGFKTCCNQMLSLLSDLASHFDLFGFEFFFYFVLISYFLCFGSNLLMTGDSLKCTYIIPKFTIIIYPTLINLYNINTIFSILN